MLLRPALSLGLLTALTIGAAPITSPALAAPDARLSEYSASVDMAPRLQWNANFGYCGETSFISAGMHFGQYTSQWTARSLASPGDPQTNKASQLLLGVNDLTAASNMRLDAIAFDRQRQQSTAQYLSWVKSMVLRGHPVIMGVYLNMTASGDPLPGDLDYDHIVPVLGIASQARMSATDRRYRPSDVITFSDNSGANPSSIYRFSFQGFQRSRTMANRADAPMYSLRNRPENYATAVIGVTDPDHVTIPVKLTSTSDGEGVQDQRWLDAPPDPRPIDITATMTIPDPSMAYHVYVYDDFAKVPIRDFNASAGNAIASWMIPAGSGARWSTTLSIMSDQTRVFRAVPQTAS